MAKCLLAPVRRGRARDASSQSAAQAAPCGGAQRSRLDLIMAEFVMAEFGNASELCRQARDPRRLLAADDDALHAFEKCDAVVLLEDLRCLVIYLALSYFARRGIWKPRCAASGEARRTHGAQADAASR
jgi:hypothetical protein